MKTYQFQKKVPLKDILKSGQVLFRIAWQTDRKTLLLFYGTAFTGGLITLGTSWVLKLLIDQLQAAQGEGILSPPMILVFSLMSLYVVNLVQTLFYQTYHLNYLDYVLRNKLQNALSKEFVKKVASLDIAHFEDPNIQDLITQVRNPLKWQIPDILRLVGYISTEFVSYLAAFIVLLPFGWWIPLIVTIITLPKLYLRSKYGALQWSIWGSGAPQMRKLYYYDSLFTNPVAVREMKIAQSAPTFIEKFDDIQQYLFSLNHGILKKYLRVSILPPILESTAIFLIAYSFLGDVLSAGISIGTFTLLITMLGQINSSVGRAAAHFGGLYENGLYLYNFAEMLNIHPVVPLPTTPHTIPTQKPPKIEFRNVSFSYPNGPSVLKDISFSIYPGESIAFVGHNGAGKSTIIKLLCRFYDVTDGQILIDDVDIRQLDLSSWYTTLGTLFQDYVQYHFSVKENIAFDDAENASLENLKAAAQKSGADAFIERMSSGYEQQLGREFENGEELSGGQWQKLAIARAFYNQPPVLILDEPTSAIDAEAEYEIFNNLEAQYQDKSLILVSHRFSTVRNADKIYVLDQGSIIENGEHDALLEKNGKYARMFLAQAKGYQ